MLKKEKLEYQRGLEKYMENNHVYGIFESMMKELMIKTPDDPIEQLKQHLSEEAPEPEKSTPAVKRVVIVGPPTVERKMHALSLAEFLQSELISLGDLLRKELNKKTELGKQIKESEFHYVSD